MDINISEVVVNYHKHPNKKHIRFGQYFINNYVPSADLPWPELFYERDYNKALEMVIEYVTDGVRKSSSDPYF